MTWKAVVQQARLQHTREEVKGLSISDLVRQSRFERIENEFTLQFYKKNWMDISAD